MKHGPKFDKATNPKLAIKKLFKFLRPYYKHILIVVLFAIGSTVFAIFGPKILGNATTEIFNGIIKKLSGTGGINFTKIGRIALFLLILYHNTVNLYIQKLFNNIILSLLIFYFFIKLLDLIDN